MADIIFSGDSSMIYYGPDIDASVTDYATAQNLDSVWTMTRIDLNWEFILSRITHFWDSEGQVAQDLVSNHINELSRNGINLVYTVGVDVVIPVWFDMNDKHLDVLSYVKKQSQDWGKIIGDSFWTALNQTVFVSGVGFGLQELQYAMTWVSGVANPASTAINAANIAASRNTLASTKGVAKQPPQVKAPVAPKDPKDSSNIGYGDVAPVLIFGGIAYLAYKVLFG